MIPIMAFTRIKTIKGRRYLYREERYREGGKVKSRIIEYLGPVDGGRRRFVGPLDPERMHDTAQRCADREGQKIEQYQREMFGETATEKKARETKEREFSQDKFLTQTETPSTDSAKESVESEAEAQEGNGDVNDDGQAV